MVDIAPIRNQTTNQKPWEGCCPVKPWEYQVTVALPVLDTPHELALVIELLRLQTIKPYILVIDTGSTPDNLTIIEDLRDVDLEVHAIRCNGYLHPSDPVAMAMDLAFSLCRSPYLFATHADCFLMRQDVIAELLELCKTKSVVGYEITPRAHDDWQGMVSHTCTMFDIKAMDKIGAGWSMRRLANIYDLPDHRADPVKPNWPDTEVLLNVLLRQHEIEPYLIGTEENFARNKDDRIDHCRTLTSGKLYGPTYYKKVRAWADDAMSDARGRVELWSGKTAVGS